MFGNPAEERAALESTYEDTASVYRETSVTGENQITKTVPQPVVLDALCALSYVGDSSRQREAHLLDYDAVIFAAPELSILPGDTISLKRFGRDDPNSRIILRFEVIGIPPVYATHQEIRAKGCGLS